MSLRYLGVDHILLAAPPGCEADARRFYGELLGWPEIPKPENLRKLGGVWFQCGPHQVHIGVENGFVASKKAHPAFHVKDVHALRAHLIEHGVTVIDDVERNDEGVGRFFVYDPFGNRLEFLEWL